MEHRILSVEKGSIAEEIGLYPDDILLSVNGEEIEDEIDYQAMIAHEDCVFLIRRGNEEIEFSFSRDVSEPLGIHFGDSMTLKPRSCHNNCVFCFIAQMPPGLRESLYVKDDDWRFSLMMGNFITLTNVSDAELDRIIRRKASPLYISIHTTRPELRCRMMNNRFAGNIMERLIKLKDAGIHFHCQIVICPGINDGDELINTLRDLRSLWPAAKSVALVPVGLTRFREHLPKLEGYDGEKAARLLDQLSPVQQLCRREIGTSFVFCSDEFYMLSRREVPPEDWYEDYPQIENGVGLVRRMISEMESAWKFDKAFGIENPKQQKRFWIPTGTCFAHQLSLIAERFAPKQTTIRVLPVQNLFFGSSITVTGLLTGRDIVNALLAQPLQKEDEILLCASVLRHERDRFLDNMSLEDFRNALPIPIHILENDGAALYDAFYQRFE